MIQIQSGLILGAASVDKASFSGMSEKENERRPDRRGWKGEEKGEG